MDTEVSKGQLFREQNIQRILNILEVSIQLVNHLETTRS